MIDWAAALHTVDSSSVGSQRADRQTVAPQRPDCVPATALSTARVSLLGGPQWVCIWVLFLSPF